MYARKHTTHTEEYLRLIVGLCGTCLLAALAFLAMRGTWDMYGKLSEASRGSSAAQTELASLEVEEARMNQDIAKLSTARGVEGELRARYGFARPGEGVIQVVNRKEEASRPNLSPTAGVLKALFSW